MQKRGEFCFLKIVCPICKEEIQLYPKYLDRYFRLGFPKSHQKCALIERNKKQISSKNPAYGKISWNHGTKGICKQNNGCFKKGQIPWNLGLNGFRKGIPKSEEWKKQQSERMKGNTWNKNIPEKVVEIPIIKPLPLMVQIPEIVKPKILEPIIEIPKSIPEIKPILSTLDPIKVALQRIEAQRLQRVKEFEEEYAKRKEEKVRKPFGYIMCITEGKFIQCKKLKPFCKHWEFCHKKVK